MDTLHLTALDLFVQGNVGMIIGYPSTLADIELAIKRAGSANALGDKFLRTSPIPQISATAGNAVNLARYQYFAVSRLTPNVTAAYAFLAYLATKEAQSSYMKNFPYDLPAIRALENERLSESIGDNDRAKFSHFLLDGVTLADFDKGIAPAFDSAVSTALDNPANADPKGIANGIITQVDCETNHLVNATGFDTACGE